MNFANEHIHFYRRSRLIAARVKKKTNSRQKSMEKSIFWFGAHLILIRANIFRLFRTCVWSFVNENLIGIRSFVLVKKIVVSFDVVDENLRNFQAPGGTNEMDVNNGCSHIQQYAWNMRMFMRRYTLVTTRLSVYVKDMNSCRASRSDFFFSVTTNLDGKSIFFSHAKENPMDRGTNEIDKRRIVIVNVRHTFLRLNSSAVCT